MKLLLIALSLCMMSCLSIANQDKVVLISLIQLQCLKLKIQYPHININCEELLNIKIDSKTSNYPSPPIIQESVNLNKEVENNHQENMINVYQKTNSLNLPLSNSNVDSNSISENSTINKESDLRHQEIMQEFKNKMRDNTNRIEKIENIVQAIIKSVSLVNTELKSLKNSFEIDYSKMERDTKTLGNIQSTQKLSQSNRIILKKNKKRYYEQNKNHDIQAKLTMLYNKKRALENKKFLSNKNNKNLDSFPKQDDSSNQDISNNQSNINNLNNSNLDINMLQKMMSNQPNSNIFTNPTNKENDQINHSNSLNQSNINNKNLSLEDINSLLSEDNIKRKEKSEYDASEIIAQKKHNVLDSEATKLFETFSNLKKKQKGYLTNLINKDSPNRQNNNESKIPRINSDSFLANLPKKENPNTISNTNNLRDSNVINSNDNSLSEIENQIKLLSSLNANNK